MKKNIKENITEFYYKPVKNSQQEKVWDYVNNWSTKKYNISTLKLLIKGGLGSGKTYVGCAVLLSFLSRLLIWIKNNCIKKSSGFWLIGDTEFDDLEVIVIGRTVVETRNIQFKELCKSLKKLGFKENVHWKYIKSPATIELFALFNNFPTIKFISKTAETPKSISGNNVCGIWSDEPFLYNDEDVFKRLAGRLRFGNKLYKFPTIYIATGTPEPSMPENIYLRNHIQYTMPTIENEENLAEGYINNLKDVYTEEEQRAYIYGEDVEISNGKIYYSFKHDKHIMEEDNMYSSLDPNMDIIVGMDFNVNPFCVVLIQIHGENVLVVKDVLQLNNANTEDMCQEINNIRRKINHKGNIIVYPDNNSGRNTGSNFGGEYSADYTIILNYKFKLKKIKQNPPLRTRTSLTNTAFEHNKIKIVNNKNCNNLIKDLKKAKWHDRKRGEFNIEKHILDAFEYPVFQLVGLNYLNSRPRK